MSKVMKAEISWVPPELGGRAKPPIGARYVTVSRFDQDEEQWLKDAWSLVLEKNEPSENPRVTIADVHFLAPNAPVHLLQEGAVFELYEGRRRVAIGKILQHQQE